MNAVCHYWCLYNHGTDTIRILFFLLDNDKISIILFKLLLELVILDNFIVTSMALTRFWCMSFWCISYSVKIHFKSWAWN